MHPKVTFLMTAYNAENYIANAIESVLKQTEQQVNLFIRNNGSTDSTGEIIRRYEARDSRIRFVENECNGVTNEGVRAFGIGWWQLDENVGDYISILDADDWLAPEFVTSMYNAAFTNDADMVVGGCYFVKEETGQLMGKRTPPRIQADSLRELAPHFIDLYPSLRTWWGKLYKRDFFLRHYQDSWTPVKPLDWVIDTIAVLKYLSQCSKFVSLDEPLYYFLHRKQSSYSAKPLDCARNWEADIIYKLGMNLVSVLGGTSRDTVAFLQNIHWGYLVEAMVGLHANRATANLPAPDKLVLLAYVLNNEVLSTYLSGNYSVVYQACHPYIQAAIQQDQNEGRIWNSYLARLYYYEMNFKNNIGSPLALPILLSCLCDSENRNNMGHHYFENENRVWNHRELSEGEKRFLYSIPEWKKFRYIHSQGIVNFIYEADRSPAVILMEESLLTAMQNEELERACDLIEEICIVSPFSMIAMYYRIYIAALIGEKELAGVLVAAARVLWPNERDIQLLYWEINGPVNS